VTDDTNTDDTNTDDTTQLNQDAYDQIAPHYAHRTPRPPGAGTSTGRPPSYTLTWRPPG
jgi:hypothetical protein